MDHTTGPENRPEDSEDRFLALLAGDSATRRDQERREVPHETRKERAAKARILANLGLRRGMSNDLELSDIELAETLDQWAFQPVRSLPHSDRSGSEAIEMSTELDDPVVTEILARKGSLHLVVSTVDIDGEEVRIEARAALPSAPSIRDDVILASITFPAGHPVTFPLHVHNEGTDEFPLWSLVGGATVPPQGPVRTAHLTIERYNDPEGNP